MPRSVEAEARWSAAPTTEHSYREMIPGHPPAPAAAVPIRRPRLSQELDHYLSLPYTLELSRDDGGAGYLAEVRELPGVRAAAPTADLAVERAEAAMRAWIADALDSGAHIPEPASEKPDHYSGNLRLQIPVSLHRELAQKAAAEQVSVGQLAIHLLSRGLAAPVRPQPGQGQRPPFRRNDRPLGRGGGRPTPADTIARSNVFAGRGLDSNRGGPPFGDRGDRNFRDP